MPSTLLLAIDIGGTKLAIGIARRDEFLATGELEEIVKEPIPSPGTPEVVIARVIGLAYELLQRHDGELCTVGISIGGPLDHLTGTVVNFPHLPGWKNI